MEAILEMRSEEIFLKTLIFAFEVIVLFILFLGLQYTRTAIRGAYAVEHVLAWGSSHELNIKPKFFSQVNISHTHVLSTGAILFDYF